MRTVPIKLYTWRVLVLDAETERTMRFRVIARSLQEAESIGADLARLGGYTGEILATATRCQTIDQAELAADPPACSPERFWKVASEVLADRRPAG